MIPKFRAWDKEKKIMDIVDGITFDGDEIWEISFPGDCWRNASNYELMQSTGLTDKNGKEIFEGDVISIVHPFRGRTHIGEVIKEAYTYNVKDFYFSHYDIPCDAFSEGTEYMEVIGNIHEHPELLEKENDE